MIQAIIKGGIVTPEQVSKPQVSEGAVLIKVVNSCISAGTEMSGVTNSGKSLIKRALDQPENVRKVYNMAKTEGFLKTLTRVKGKLDGGNPTGYSISGVVIAVGKGVDKFNIGDNVAAAGAGLANHAEFVDVPHNLVMKMPKEVSFTEASTVTLGGIAMQGVRRADLRLGEYAVVIGCGILGLLSVQMLKAAGVRVIATDLDNDRLKIAKSFGADMVVNPLKEDSINLVNNFTGGHGADAVLFTAATSSSKPLSEAFQMSRKKGKVVLVGVVGMELKREDIYQKELDFQISTSYGPGRYDKLYEEKGIDYPYAYVRWTENRNMSEYLRLLADNIISLEAMINGVFEIEDVTNAFESLKFSERKPLMVILDYGSTNLPKRSFNENETKIVVNDNYKISDNIVNVALIGAGSFGVGMHLPNIKKLSSKFKLKAVMSRKGHAAKVVAEQYKAEYSTTDYNEILNDNDIDLVLICTRHDSHAELTIKALKAGKNVFVEKPLATTKEELDEIKEFYNNDFKNKPLVFVGFNRRFSKYAKEIRKYTDQRINPLVMRYRMNAGYIPMDSWVHEHGGRIVGEGCHIVDFTSSFAKSPIVDITVQSLEPINDKYSKSDNKSITIKYEDGSIASIEYFANGSKKLSKEFFEVHFDGKSIVLDDYKSLKGFDVKVNEIKTESSQKGQYEELLSLYDALKVEGAHWPIDFWDIYQTTKSTIEINNYKG